MESVKTIPQKPQAEKRPSFFGDRSEAEIKKLMNEYMDRRTHLPILPFQEVRDGNG